MIGKPIQYQPMSQLEVDDACRKHEFLMNGRMGGPRRPRFGLNLMVERGELEVRSCALAALLLQSVERALSCDLLKLPCLRLVSKARRERALVARMVRRIAPVACPERDTNQSSAALAAAKQQQHAV